MNKLLKRTDLSQNTGKDVYTHEQEERDTADLAEIEQRSALLTEVHTYNRRYSGEPRTLLEMIRSEKINDVTFPYPYYSEIFLSCCGTWCTTYSVEKACTLLFSSGFSEFWIYQFEPKINWNFLEFQISETSVKSPETFHSTPFLDLQPPDIHFTLDLWPT